MTIVWCQSQNIIEPADSKHISKYKPPAAAGHSSATPAQRLAQALVRGYDAGLATTTRAAGGAGALQPARTDAAAGACGAAAAADAAARGPHHGLQQWRP